MLWGGGGSYGIGGGGQKRNGRDFTGERGRGGAQAKKKNRSGFCGGGRRSQTKEGQVGGLTTKEGENKVAGALSLEVWMFLQLRPIGKSRPLGGWGVLRFRQAQAAGWINRRIFHFPCLL